MQWIYTFWQIKKLNIKSSSSTRFVEVCVCVCVCVVCVCVCIYTGNDNNNLLSGKISHKHVLMSRPTMRDLLIRDRVGSAKPGGTWQTSSARFLLPSNNPLKERMWFFLITAWFIVSVPCPHFHFPRYNATGGLSIYPRGWNTSHLLYFTRNKLQRQIFFFSSSSCT